MSHFSMIDNGRSMSVALKRPQLGCIHEPRTSRMGTATGSQILSITSNLSMISLNTQGLRAKVAERLCVAVASKVNSSTK